MNEYDTERRLRTTLGHLVELANALDHAALCLLNGKGGAAGRATIGLASGRVLDVVAIGRIPTNRDTEMSVGIVHEIDGRILRDSISAYDIETVQHPASMVLDQPYTPLVAPEDAAKLAVATIEAMGELRDDDETFRFELDGPHRTPFMVRLMNDVKAGKTAQGVSQVLLDVDTIVNMLGETVPAGETPEQKSALAIIRQAAAKDRMYMDMIRQYRPYIERARWLMPFDVLPRT